MSPESNLPSPSEKPSLLDWLETFLPFKLPRIPFVQTAKNLDKAVAAIVLAGGENVATRIQTSTTRIDARSTAEKAFIEHGQASIALGSSELAERALNYALGDAIAAQKNREEILRIAVDHLDENSPREDAPESIDDDWLNAFKRFSETKSNADIQQLWARILSAEIRKPGSTSLRTLDFLSTVSMEDAKRIVKIFPFVMNNMFIPNWVYKENYHPYGEFLTLQEMGVVSGVFGLGGPSTDILVTPQSELGRYAVFFEYNGMAAILETTVETYHLQIPAMFLTEVGRNLFAITDTKQTDHALFEKFATQLGKDPVNRISLAWITGRNQSGIQFTSQRVIYSKT